MELALSFTYLERNVVLQQSAGLDLDTLRTLATFHPKQSSPSSSPGNSSCGAALAAVQAAALAGGSWAVKLLDSDGKLGPGILEGNTQWLGRYSECLDPGVAQAANGTSYYLVNFYLALALGPGAK